MQGASPSLHSYAEGSGFHTADHCTKVQYTRLPENKQGQLRLMYSFSGAETISMRRFCCPECVSTAEKFVWKG